MGQTVSHEIRSIITDDEFGGFRITIPRSDTQRVRCGCGCAVSAFLFAGTLLYILSDLKHLTGGMKFLAFFTVVGLLLAYGLVDSSMGRQVVLIDEKALILREETALGPRSRTFDLAGVRNLRPYLFLNVPRGSKCSPSAVLFDHGGRTHRFGDGLTEHEVIRLIKTIRQRFRIRDDMDDAEPLPIVT